MYMPMRGSLLAISLIASVALTASFSGRAEAQVIGGGNNGVDSYDQTQAGKTRQVRDKQNLINIKLENASVEESLEKISRQSGIRVVFSDDVYPIKKRVNYEAKQQPIDQVIAVVIAGTGLRARYSNSNEIRIELANTKDTLASKFGSIRGNVKDSSTGKAMEGVAISVRGLNKTVTTNSSGNFGVPAVPVGDVVLDIRAVGFKTISKTLQIIEGKSSHISIAMFPSATSLSEVVTTVTGMQRKIEIGNDVTTINADSVLKTAPITSVSELLNGRVPGLAVTKTSGVPGAPSRLRFRGIGGGLISGVEGSATNDPIVIVDGIRINATQSGITDQNLAPGNTFSGRPGSRSYSSSFPPPSAIDQIDPNSIERIDVYKGPSAAALYGSDAANGVIVITTKKGKSGPVRWSASFAQGIEYLPGSYSPPGYYPFCTNPASIASRSQLCSSTESFNNYTLDSVVRFQALDNPSLKSFTTGGRGEQSATLSGGQGAYTYSITGTMARDLGSVKMPSLYQEQFKSVYDSSPAQWMKRPNKLNSNSINTAFNIEARKDMFITFNGRISNSYQAQTSGQLQVSTLASKFIDTLTINTATIAEYATKINARRTTTDYSATLRWSPFSYLPIHAIIGNSTENRKDTKFTPYGLKDFNNAIGDGYYSVGSATQQTKTARINTTLFPDWKVSTALGVEIVNNDRSQFQGINDSVLEGISVPTGFVTANQGQTRSTTGGWFVEPRLNLNSRFFVNPGFRFDGNTLSGSQGGLWSLFPRLNFSWLAIDGSKDEGILGKISMLRPRIAFGVAGVQPAPGWQLRLLSAPVGSDAQTGIMAGDGLALSSMGNTDLHPERTREIEGGFDLEIYEGRHSLSVSVFKKVRTDAIETIQLPSSIYGGFLSQYVNIGEIQNTGLELSLSTTILETSSLRWQVNTSISKYNNKLTKLNSEDAYIDLGEGSRYMAGYPLNGRWERPILGYSPTANGRLRYSDVLVADSAVYVGRQAPNFEVPLSTNISLLGGAVGVNLSFHYKDGMTQFSSGSEQQLTNIFLNPDATLAEQAIALAASACGFSGMNNICSRSGLVQTVNSFRFSSMSVNYNVPRGYLSRFGLPSVQLALQSSNMGLWTSYRGKDPDVNSVTVGESTVDNGQIPSPRTWRVQVRVGN